MSIWDSTIKLSRFSEDEGDVPITMSGWLYILYNIMTFTIECTCMFCQSLEAN